MSRYMDLFLAESKEHLEAADTVLGVLRDGEDRESLDNLFRHIHSLKGMAATMGFGSMVRVAHAVEDLLDALRDRGGAGIGDALCTLMWEALAYLGASLESTRAGTIPGEGASGDLSRRLAAEAVKIRGYATPPPPGIADTAPTVARNGDPEKPRTAPAGHCRWRIELHLQNGESRFAGRTVKIIRELGRLGEIDHISPPLTDPEAQGPLGRIVLSVTTDRSRDDLERELASIRGIEGFSTERAPAAAGDASAREGEGGSRFVRVRSGLLDTLVEDALDLVLAQENMASVLPADPTSPSYRMMQRCRQQTKRLYGNLMELRLVPFETVAHRLTVGVQDLAERLGKTVRFDISGRDVRLDRTVLESMVDPLLHLVRNALDHGIENLENRIEQGKPGPGRITLRLAQRNDRVRIVLEDDGKGLDPVRIRSAAVGGGFLTPEEAGTLSDREANLLVTLPGFSTAEKVGSISGRGVGMDVVRDAVESLGGRIRIESEPGKGTAFHLDLPRTLSVIQALLVRAGGELYALPITAVERTLDLSVRSVSGIQGRRRIRVDGTDLRLRCLESHLDGNDAILDPGVRGAALLSQDDPPAALAVDEIVGRRDLLVRPLEPPLRAMRRYTGAALLEDGTMALVLDSEIFASADPR